MLAPRSHTLPTTRARVTNANERRPAIFAKTQLPPEAASRRGWVGEGPTRCLVRRVPRASGRRAGVAPCQACFRQPGLRCTRAARKRGSRAHPALRAAAPVACTAAASRPLRRTTANLRRTCGMRAFAPAALTRIARCSASRPQGRATRDRKAADRTALWREPHTNVTPEVLAGVSRSVMRRCARTHPLCLQPSGTRTKPCGTCRKASG